MSPSKLARRGALGGSDVDHATLRVDSARRAASAGMPTDLRLDVPRWLAPRLAALARTVSSQDGPLGLQPGWGGIDRLQEADGRGDAAVPCAKAVLLGGRTSRRSPRGFPASVAWLRSTSRRGTWCGTRGRIRQGRRTGPRVSASTSAGASQRQLVRPGSSPSDLPC